jgi:hypothetical protein
MICRLNLSVQQSGHNISLDGAKREWFYYGIVCLVFICFLTFAGFAHVQAMKSLSENEERGKLEAQRRQLEKQERQREKLEEDAKRRDAEKERERRLKEIPLLHTRDKVPLFYPITVIGVVPVTGDRKGMYRATSKKQALLWANELRDKGYADVKLYAYIGADRGANRTEYCWGHIDSLGRFTYDAADGL